MKSESLARFKPYLQDGVCFFQGELLKTNVRRGLKSLKVNLKVVAALKIAFERRTRVHNGALNK